MNNHAASDTPRFEPALLEAARSGDQGALLRLLTLAQPDIRRYAQRSCSHVDDVDDAVQETLWVLHRRVGTLRAVTSFSGWLLAVVRRECMRMARKAFRSHDDIDELANSEALARRSQDDLRIDLHNAIDSLPPHYKEVLLMRDFMELTLDEISGDLRITRESAKARLHRARTMIREYLKD